MPNKILEAQWRRWVKSRPISVRRLIKEFPLGTRFLIKGELFYLVGWTEGDELLISKSDPARNYEQAYKTRRRVCAEHIRKGEADVLPSNG